MLENIISVKIKIQERELMVKYFQDIGMIMGKVEKLQLNRYKKQKLNNYYKITKKRQKAY